MFCFATQIFSWNKCRRKHKQQVIEFTSQTTNIFSEKVNQKWDHFIELQQPFLFLQLADRHYVWIDRILHTHISGVSVCSLPNHWSDILTLYKLSSHPVGLTESRVERSGNIQFTFPYARCATIQYKVAGAHLSNHVSVIHGGTTFVHQRQLSWPPSHCAFRRLL